MTYAMIVTVLCGFTIILLMNMAALFGYIPPRYISPNDVRGMAVEHDGHLYTLNFQQQNQLIDIFNRSKVIVASDMANRKITPEKVPAIQKIIIYRFDAPNIDITPVGYVSKTNTSGTGASLVFSTPDFASNALLEESTPDGAIHILLSSYDHPTKS